MNEKRESIAFDVVYAGGGPANLASTIHLKNLISRHNKTRPAEAFEASVAVVEKGRHPGAHLLSGAILDPRALKELLPDYLQRGCPLENPVRKESIWYLTGKRKFTFPLVPEPFRNDGLPMISLSRLGYWMTGEAEKAGVEIFTGTAAASALIENSMVCGLLTGETGLDRKGNPKPDHLAGIELRAKVTVIGEGAAGTLASQLQNAYSLQAGAPTQLFETGVKEVWQVPEGRIGAGEILHSFGYPLSPDTYGGGWLYAFSPTELSVGFVTSIDRSCPGRDPHANLQRFKQHPHIAPMLEDGTMLEYCAKTIVSGGLDAMGRMHGPGFLITGESAGILDMQRLKGIHLAMKSGMLAAETIFESLLRNDFSEGMLQDYDKRFGNSWAYDELCRSRRFRQAFDKGLYHGLLQAGMQLKFPGVSSAAANLLARKDEGPEPHRNPAKKKGQTLPAFSPDGHLTFTREECLYRSGTMHEENQPCHLRIRPEDIETICLRQCRNEFENPCTRFCPAKVYEFIERPEPALKISPSNCLHCKTCSLADPYGIITWVPPEGGGGPGYTIC